MFSNKGLRVQGREYGSKEGRHDQEGTTTALRAADGYGQTEHSLRRVRFIISIKVLFFIFYFDGPLFDPSCTQLKTD
jgi:hypothetical protein